MTADSRVLLVNRIGSDLRANGMPLFSRATHSAAALTVTAADTRPLDVCRLTRAPA